MRKLIFLDIDGVLNSTQYWYDQGKHLPLGKSGALDPAAIRRFNQIIDACWPVEVILSSSWRGLATPESTRAVEKMLRQTGYTHHLTTCTPNIPGPRYLEIAAVIDVWRYDRFVVFDDDPDAWHDDFQTKGRFVNTNYLVGLQDNGVELAISWLKGK